MSSSCRVSQLHSTEPFLEAPIDALPERDTPDVVIAEAVVQPQCTTVYLEPASGIVRAN
jgi:hypothetical protein